MSKGFTFANGFKAELVENTMNGQSILRLYSPNDTFLASVPSDEEHYHAAAEGLLSGYFCGWRDCRHRMTEAISTACKQEISN